MTKRCNALKALKMVWDTGQIEAFTLSLVSQRDMFVVCDILTQLESTQYLKELSLDLMIKVIKKMRQPKFLIDSKYKIHKLCAYQVLKKVLDFHGKRVNSELTDQELQEFALLMGQEDGEKERPQLPLSKEQKQQREF